MTPAMPNAAGWLRRVVVAVVVLAVAAVAAPSRAADAPAAKKPAAKKAAAAKKKAEPKAVPAKEALKEMVEGEDVREFRGFCDSWMQKLRDRETYNVAHITWDKAGDGSVSGKYTSYGTERTCIAREEPGKDPIGKITYREIVYRRQGPDPTAAMTATPTIVEQTDVTEIFRYAKGRWQY
jgi:hypothetical protein